MEALAGDVTGKMYGVWHMRRSGLTGSFVVNAQTDARPMYKQRSWQAVTNRRLKTVSLVVRALQPVSRILGPATTTQSRLGP